MQLEKRAQRTVRIKKYFFIEYGTNPSIASLNKSPKARQRPPDLSTLPRRPREARCWGFAFGGKGGGEGGVLKTVRCRLFKRGSGAPNTRAVGGAASSYEDFPAAAISSQPGACQNRSGGSAPRSRGAFRPAKTAARASPTASHGG